MKFLEKIPYAILAGFIYLLLIYSCANQGMPSGGPIDSLPPVLLHAEPIQGQLNYTGNEIRLTFDEYVVSDKVMDFLVVSPPLEKRPSFRMKSKTLILQFNEKLRDSVTYSFDFKNSIEDNNERNPYKSLRLTFSTGNVLDTLRVAGLVKNAANLELADKSLVMLYRNPDDSAVIRTIPDYIARTDEKGLYLFDNVAPGSYHLYAINDANSDMKYNPGVEEFAFYDSLIIPKAIFVEELDTIAEGADSLLINGYVHYLPEPVYLLQFKEDLFDQFLTSSERESKYKCMFIFEEPVSDTFGIHLLNSDSNDWYQLETNPSMDTLIVWVADTTIANLDTLKMVLDYTMADSAGIAYLKKDTLDMYYLNEKIERDKKKKKEGEIEVPEVPQFTFADNLKSTGFDLNQKIWITSPEPIAFYDSTQIRLKLAKDSTAKPLNMRFIEDTSRYRTYSIGYSWEPDTEYLLEIDSAAFTNIFGVTNKKVIKKFTTQKDDYYGSVIVNLSHVECPVVVQVLKAEAKEELIAEKNANADGEIEFRYLGPIKIYLKVIYDTNGNGKWDGGSFTEKRQPERVAYFKDVIKVRSNWEQKESWDITFDPEYPKVLFDAEAEAQRKKAEEEKARENQKQPSGNSGSSGMPNVFGRP
jgi:hypothetical protein